MERDLAGTALGADEFKGLQQVCRGDRKFPQTYEDWQALVSIGTSQVLAQGQQVEVIALAVDDFVTWCQKVAVVPGLDALRAYMILRRRAHSGQPTGPSRTRGEGGGTTGDEGNQAVPPCTAPLISMSRGRSPAPIGWEAGIDAVSKTYQALRKPA